NLLRIKIPESNHKLTPDEGPSRAPRVRQAVSGDFDVRVKVVSVTAPELGGDGMTAGGLVVGRGTESFVSFSRYTPQGETTETTVPRLNLHGYGRVDLDALLFKITAADRTKSLSLRLVREKNRVTGFSSFDGKAWEARGTGIVDWPETV